MVEVSLETKLHVDIVNYFKSNAIRNDVYSKPKTILIYVYTYVGVLYIFLSRNDITVLKLVQK